MRLTKPIMAAFAAVAIISGTATAAAVTTLDFSSKANQWSKENCTQKELAKKKADIQDVSCYTYAQAKEHDSEIATLQKTSNSQSSYTLHSWQTRISNGQNSNLTINEKVVVPTDGVISAITAIMTEQHATSEKIGSGSVAFQVMVNGKLENFSTSLDSTGEHSIATNGMIPVKAGDLVQIHQTNKDLEVIKFSDWYYGINTRITVQVSQK